MNKLLARLMVKKEMAKYRLADFGKKLASEEGDTNFISIIIQYSYLRLQIYEL